jgi:gamma-glutamyltranspeptidase/glutathione hydrolase
MTTPQVGKVGPKPEVQAENAVCASQHPLVTDAMLTVMRDGGTAFDAAIAGCLVSATVQHDMTNHGGAVTMICWDARTEQTYELASMGTVVSGLPPFRPVPMGPGDDPGLSPCALIPGFMPGLKAIHERFGTVPWATLCEPAIHWAQEGHEVGSFEFMILSRTGDFYLQTPSGRAHFAPDGFLPQVGQRWPKPELAATLTRLAAEGPDDFITGHWGREFVRRANELGWPIELSHMDAVPPRWGPGMRYRFGADEVVQQAPPERQAVMSAIVLGVLGALGVGELGHPAESGESLYYTAHALRRADYETGFLNDPTVFEDPSSYLMSPEFHQTIADVISRSRPKIDLTEHVRLLAAANRPGRAADPGPTATVGSCELSLVDQYGNWVQILNTYQGGGIPGEVVGGVPMVGSTFGTTFSDMLHGWFTGDGRLRSAIGNTLVLRDGKPRLGLGTPGVPHITVPQLLSSLLHHGLDPRAADDARRMTPLADDYTVAVESGLPEQVVADVAKLGVLVKPMRRYHYSMGSFQMSWRGEDGLLHGSAGVRRAGEAAGF